MEGQDGVTRAPFWHIQGDILMRRSWMEAARSSGQGTAWG